MLVALCGFAPWFLGLVTYLVLRPLVCQLHLLLLDNHLFLAVGQSPRDTQQQGARADDPERLSTEREPGLEPRCRCVVL